MPLWRSLVALLCLILAVPALAQVKDRDPAWLPDMMDRGSARLVPEGNFAPGEDGDLALVFQPQEGWHGYWRNPGDAGVGLRLDWRLPEGWEAAEPLYPVPQTYLIAGLMNHIYEGEHAFLIPISVPANAAQGAYPVTVYGEWLTCSDLLCVPQNGVLTTTITVGEGEGQSHPRFGEWRAAIAPQLDSMATYELTGNALRLAIPIPAAMGVEAPHVFIGEEQLVDYAADQRFWRDGDRLLVEIPRGGLGAEVDQITGIIALGGARDGLRFAAEPGEVTIAGEALSGTPETPPLALLLLAALAGGLILNLMPCVFPILSLKALSLARAGESEAEARREGLAYTGGVILACLALGGLMLVLREGGAQIGWAFQLQEPGVVVALLVLAMVLTVNFAGVFELPGLPIRGGGKPASAFGTGLLAAFVATPCTGPFMAAAMGAALLLPWEQALGLFAALGLGLALPFLLLGYVPALRNRLPKPGAWMERFRRLMAFPMGLTALALIWLTVRIGGKPFALVALAMLFGLLLGLVVTGRLQRAGKMAWPAFGLIAAPFLIFGAFALPSTFDEAGAGKAESIHQPLDYDEMVLLDTVTSQGKPVFLWFTADWCVTCKVNESVAIEREEVREAFEEAGVITMRGDWTRADPEITKFLEQQGAAGVPLYLWWVPNNGPEQLPQVLTPAMLVERAEAL